jgi:hypothetical protein
MGKIILLLPKNPRRIQSDWREYNLPKAIKGFNDMSSIRETNRLYHPSF